MKYTKKDLGSYNVHMIETEKYKTITMRIVFRRPLDRETITMHNILTSLLVQSTKEYNSKRKLAIRSQDLYSARVGVVNTRMGNYHNTIFTLNSLCDKYTEEGNFKESIKLLSEILFNPDIKNNAFIDKNVEIIKSRKKNQLASIKEDSGSYSLIRAMESFDRDAPSAIRMNGYIEDIEEIDGKKLYEYYQGILRDDLVDIFIIGNFRKDEVLSEIRKLFKFRILKKNEIEYSIKPKHARKRRLFAKETISNNQSKLIMICRFSKLSDYELNYVLTIYNSILGGGADSKLFKIVREENSLCYGISSYPCKLDNTFIIQTGIDKDNYKKTLELTESIMEDMKKGKFTEEDIDIAKQYAETSYDEIEESPNRMLDYYMMREFLGLDDLDVGRSKMLQVTKKEIIKVAKKIKMDTVFMLEGDKNEKE